MKNVDTFRRKDSDFGQRSLHGHVLGELVASIGATAWLSPAEVPPGEAVEVLLTDLATIAEAVAGAAPLVGKQAARQRTLGNLGVVAVGTADWADANLAADFTPRELALACGLAARLARSRSQRSELAELHDATQRLAQTDPLTGLANRREWDEQLSARWSLAKRSGKRVWLALVDLDRFKGFNDRHGMRAGDELLRAAAKGLAAGLRGQDLIARLGGDEFGVLVVGVDEVVACRIFERLCAAVKADSGPDGSLLSASIGCAGSTAERTTPEVLFAAAEQGLRDAKQAGGNCVRHGELSGP